MIKADSFVVLKPERPAASECDKCLCVSCRLMSSCPVYDGQEYVGGDWARRLREREADLSHPTRCSQLCRPPKKMHLIYPLEFLEGEETKSCPHYAPDPKIEDVSMPLAMWGTRRFGEERKIFPA
jgi:hypothetical protein